MIHGLLKPLIPDYYIESIYQITPEFLQEMGIRLVITDLDNTLSSRYCKSPNLRSIEWVKAMQERGIGVVILSNGRSRKRVGAMAQQLEIELFFHMARKPSGVNYKKIEKHFGIPLRESAVIGDQTITDILGGNRQGATTFLVSPYIETEFFVPDPKQPREPIFFPIMKLIDQSVCWLGGVKLNKQLDLREVERSS